MHHFQGLCAFPITPANAEGVVDAAALQVLLTRLTDARVDSIGLLGSTGSYPYLSREQRRRAVHAAVETAAGAVPVMIGIGALRTDEAVLLGQDAREAGADAVLLAPVSYAPLTDDEVFEHFATVAQAVGLPLCIYDNPTTTRFTFTAALVGRLSRLPHVTALKTPAPTGAAAGHSEAMRQSTAPGFSVGYSVDANAAEALLAGGEAWYSVAAGLFPAPCLRIAAAIREGDATLARRLNAQLQPLWDLFAAHSSLRVIYAAANLLGLCRAAPPRPILPLPEPVQRQVSQTLATLALR